MSATFVRRHDITVAEERGHSYTWTASIYGDLSTGESVDMSRTGNTFAKALANLEQAIRENGWEIR